MKKMILPLVLVLLLPTLSFAESLKFSWSYTAEEQAKIVGFRLYRDGTTVDTDKILPAVRTVTVPRQIDKKSHTYHLTAYSIDAESGPSNTAIDAYIAATVTPVGSFKVEIVQ